MLNDIIAYSIRKAKLFFANLHDKTAEQSITISDKIEDSNNEEELSSKTHHQETTIIKIEDSKIYNALKDSAVNDKIEENRLQAENILAIIDEIKSNIVSTESEAFLAITKHILSKFHNKNQLIDFIATVLDKKKNKKSKSEIIKITVNKDNTLNRTFQEANKNSKALNTATKKTSMLI